jgi:hypothetical protein
MPKAKAKVKKAEPRPKAGKKGGTAEDGPDLSSLKKIFDEASKETAAKPPLQWVDVECPYCGESFEVRVDPSEGGVDMAQECQVCAKVVQLAVEVEDGELSVSAYRD